MRILYFLTLFLLLGNISLKAQQNYKIGDIYTFDDNTKGIVFYVDTDGHGLVVSMEQEKGRWEEESNYVYCQDIVNIPNEELPCLEYNQGLGMIYTSYILEQLGNVKPIAAKYSRNKGVDWYLPSAAEMYQLMIANKDKTIDNCLKENDCKKISRKKHKRIKKKSLILKSKYAIIPNCDILFYSLFLTKIRGQRP